MSHSVCDIVVCVCGGGGEFACVQRVGLKGKTYVEYSLFSVVCCLECEIFAVYQSLTQPCAMR